MKQQKGTDRGGHGAMLKEDSPADDGEPQRIISKELSILTRVSGGRPGRNGRDPG